LCQLWRYSRRAASRHDFEYESRFAMNSSWKPCNCVLSMFVVFIFSSFSSVTSVCYTVVCVVVTFADSFVKSSLGMRRGFSAFLP
jgi:hypothetical protein